jgi:hypothetical protein
MVSEFTYCASRSRKAGISLKRHRIRRTPRREVPTFPRRSSLALLARLRMSPNRHRRSDRLFPLTRALHCRDHQYRSRESSLDRSCSRAQDWLLPHLLYEKETCLGGHLAMHHTLQYFGLLLNLWLDSLVMGVVFVLFGHVNSQNQLRAGWNPRTCVSSRARRQANMVKSSLFSQAKAPILAALSTLPSGQTVCAGEIRAFKHWSEGCRRRM